MTARSELDEHAPLRRVAALVSRAAPPEEVFAAVAAEAGRLLDADLALLSRYHPDGAATVLGSWARGGGKAPLPADSRMDPEGLSLHSLVFATGQPVRLDDYGDDPGAGAAFARRWGIRSVVGVPINLRGRLWGIIGVASTREEPLPGDTKAWLTGFTELVATAVVNAQVRDELRGYADEQAALRRVAELVARGAPPEEVFAAVTGEAGQLLGASVAGLCRYDAGDTATIVATWTRRGVAPSAAVGGRSPIGGRNVLTLVLETGRPARIDDYAAATGPAGSVGRGWGLRWSLGVPISVDGCVWGAMVVSSTRDAPPPVGAEARLAGFTELVATAIANAQARVDLSRFAEQQAALRRVATLVARAAPPEEVFTAVATEVGRVLEVDISAVARYDEDGSATIVGTWGPAGPNSPLRVGQRSEHGGRHILSLVFQTGRPARMDDYREADGVGGELARELGFRSAVGAPISVEGRLWGAIGVTSTREEPLPLDTEARLAGFTKLVGTALANADAQAALTASRARIVAAAASARRRIERDLHDGAQQQVVSLALQLKAALTAVPPEAGDLAGQLQCVADGVVDVLEELRDLAHGIHPAALSGGGLPAALRALARRCAVPVRLDVAVDGRLPEPIELAAYDVVAEALANAAQHADATVIDLEVQATDVLRVCVRDDGCGGADATRGSGLVGLTDRVESLGGRTSLHSPAGGGTRLEIALPLPAAFFSPSGR